LSGRFAIVGNVAATGEIQATAIVEAGGNDRGFEEIGAHLKIQHRFNRPTGFDAIAFSMQPTPGGGKVPFHRQIYPQGNVAVIFQLYQQFAGFAGMDGD
jgi:hypothetical protein